MNDFQPQYALWNEFLSVWPASRLSTMTLDEYNQAGSKESFTYWIESRLDGMGSIWGGSSFKFGVFSRKDTGDKPSDAKLSYSDTHGWYSSLGESAQEAFEKVRGFVAQIAEWAAQGDLASIEAFEHLGEAFKWKVAFHYQNQQTPVIVPIFKRAPLAVYVGLTASESMLALQQAVMVKRPAGLGVLEFGRQVWEAWSQKNLVIWKLSHGSNSFSPEEHQHYLQAELAVIYGDTAKGQGEAFQKAPVGNLFYLCHGNESIPLLGQFISEPMPCDKDQGWLQRRFRVLKTAVKQGGYQGSQKGWTPNFRSTFKQVPAQDLPEFESNLLKPFFGTDLAELAALAGEPIDMSNSNISSQPTSASPLSTETPRPKTGCFNRIYYGPPGTGKTYTLMQLLKRDYEQPLETSSSAEWRKQMIAEKIVPLKWWEGIAAALYDFGHSVTVPEIAQHPFIQAIAAVKSQDQKVKKTTLWRELQNHTIESSKTVNYKFRTSPAIFDKTPDSRWEFAGDWQEACADLISLVDQLKTNPQDSVTLQRYSFVTFHQSYGYEEFVEGLRPVLNGDDDASAVGYEIRPGAFKELCRRARQTPGQRFAMVIDEINRGNISKIFGELITLIEPDKRDPLDRSPPPLALTLAYSGDKFSVPANVDIIGTMNTADRSLALLDTALRRRFDFVPLLPDTRGEKDPADPHSAPLAGLVVHHSGGESIDVRHMLQRINERIEALYDREHCIGHAYLTGLANVADGEARFAQLADIFRNRIIPLLEEYFFEDRSKIRLVLGDNQKPDEAQFFTEGNGDEQTLNELFGSNHGLDSYATKRRYDLQPAAFDLPAAYIGIYLTVA